MRSSLLKNSRIIKPTLFKVLDESTPCVEKAFNLMGNPDLWDDNYVEYFDNVGLAKESLLLFMDAFYLQFFVYGYGLDIESIEDSKETINDLTDGPNGPRPEKMIASFNDYYLNVFFELPETGYGGGSKFVLRTTFCSALPQLFDAFLEEGEAVITNFEEIRTKIKEFMPKLHAICQR